MKIRDLHPGLEVDVLEGDQAQVAYMVETGEAMIGLMYDRDLPDALEGEALREQSPYALFAAEDPRAGSDTVSLHDLVDDPLVLLDQPLSREYVNGLFAAIGRDPNIAMKTASFELVRSLVGNGLGYSLLVTKPAGNISYDGKRLEIRPLKGRHDPVALALVRRQNGKLSEKAEDFSDICRAYFTGRQC
jgi:DNA-binding transcriptional LysR family regulator